MCVCHYQVGECNPNQWSPQHFSTLLPNIDSHHAFPNVLPTTFPATVLPKLIHTTSPNDRVPQHRCPQLVPTTFLSNIDFRGAWIMFPVLIYTTHHIHVHRNWSQPGFPPARPNIDPHIISQYRLPSMTLPVLTMVPNWFSKITSQQL